MKSRVLRVEFLKVNLEFFAASLSSINASAGVLFAISHHLPYSFDLSVILVTLVLQCKALLDELIVFTAESLQLSLVPLKRFVDANLQEFLEGTTLLRGGFELDIGLLRDKQGGGGAELLLVGFKLLLKAGDLALQFELLFFDLS